MSCPTNYYTAQGTAMQNEYVRTSPITTGYVAEPTVTHIVEPKVNYVTEPRVTYEYVPQITYVAQPKTTYETVPYTTYECRTQTTYDVKPIQQEQVLLVQQEVPVYYTQGHQQTVYTQPTYGTTSYAQAAVQYAAQTSPRAYVQPTSPRAQRYAMPQQTVQQQYYGTQGYKPQAPQQYIAPSSKKTTTGMVQQAMSNQYGRL